MSTSLSVGPETVVLQGTLQNVRTSPGNIQDTLQFKYTGPTLTNGTAAGQADREYKSGAYSLAASSTLTINFASLTDAFGNAISYARFKRFYIELTSATSATSITVGKAGLLDPTVAPVLTQSASTGSLSDGTYLVAYSWINGTGGETLISPTSSIVVNGGGSSQKIILGAVTLPSGASGMNIYTSLASTGKAVAYQGTQNAGTAYNITTLASTNALAPLFTNTALTTIHNAFGAQSDRVRVRNGGVLYLSTGGDATGYAVSGSNTYLNIVNEDGVNAATLNLSFIGCSA